METKKLDKLYQEAKNLSARRERGQSMRCIQKMLTFYALEFTQYKISLAPKFTRNPDVFEFEFYLFLCELRDHLVEVIDYSICCEARHYAYECRDSKASLPKKYLRGFGYGAERYRRSRDKNVKLLRQLIPDIKRRCELLKTVFMLNWEYGYGGPVWSRGCEGLKQLLAANSTQELILAIDHAYDLQHHNGLLFDKHNDYDLIVIPFEKLLDIKEQLDYSQLLNTGYLERKYVKTIQRQL